MLKLECLTEIYFLFDRHHGFGVTADPTVLKPGCLESLAIFKKKLLSYLLLAVLNLPDVKMHILPTVLHTFPMELVRRICLDIKIAYPW